MSEEKNTEMKQIHAPFTEEQVLNLNRYQNAGWMHPFTCIGKPFVVTQELFEETVLPEHQHREDLRSMIGKTQHSRETCENEGLLIATTEGWVCPCGEYKQNWAHEFMAEPHPDNYNPMLDKVKEQLEDGLAKLYAKHDFYVIGQDDVNRELNLIEINKIETQLEKIKTSLS